MSNDWLEKLKVGDEVAVKYSNCMNRIDSNYYQISKIKRITKTLIIIEDYDEQELKFRKRNGFELSDSYYHNTYLVEINDEVINEIAIYNAKYNIYNLVEKIMRRSHKVDYSNITHLEKIVDLLNVVVKNMVEK